MSKWIFLLLIPAVHALSISPSAIDLGQVMPGVTYPLHVFADGPFVLESPCADLLIVNDSVRISPHASPGAGSCSLLATNNHTGLLLKVLYTVNTTPKIGAILQIHSDPTPQNLPLVVNIHAKNTGNIPLNQTLLPINHTIALMAGESSSWTYVRNHSYTLGSYVEQWCLEPLGVCANQTIIINEPRLPSVSLYAQKNGSDMLVTVISNETAPFGATLVLDESSHQLIIFPGKHEYRFAPARRTILLVSGHQLAAYEFAPQSFPLKIIFIGGCFFLLLVILFFDMIKKHLLIRLFRIRKYFPRR